MKKKAKKLTAQATPAGQPGPKNGSGDLPMQDTVNHISEAAPMPEIKLFCVVNPSNINVDGELSWDVAYEIEIPGLAGIPLSTNAAADTGRALHKDGYEWGVPFSLMERATGKIVFFGVVGEAGGLPKPGSRAA